MSPDPAAMIDAARDLAWRPMHNLGHASMRYAERRESADRLTRLVAEVYVGPQRDPILDCLVAAIRRAAACTFSNRCGRAYYERRQAIAELRGCLVVWDRERLAVAA